MTLDAAAIGRRIKPERRRTRLSPRPLPQLIAATDLAGAGRARLLFDTNIYIHDAGGTLPAAAQALVDDCISFHCSVCIGELMVGIGNSRAAPDVRRAQRDHYFELIETIPDHRLLTPDSEAWAEAGLIAGTLARIQDFQPPQRRQSLNDALIYLTAAKAGVAVLTGNRDEFDLIQQVAGRGMFVHC